jgi:hypothetical protein
MKKKFLIGLAVFLACSTGFQNVSAQKTRKQEIIPPKGKQ